MRADEMLLASSEVAVVGAVDRFGHQGGIEPSPGFTLTCLGRRTNVCFGLKADIRAPGAIGDCGRTHQADILATSRGRPRRPAQGDMAQPFRLSYAVA
jgi:hypothetical protein